MDGVVQLIQSILSSTAGIYIAIGLLLYLMFSIKKGTISFHGKGLDIGKSKEEERTILRDQLELVSTMCESTFGDLPEELQNDKGKYIVCKTADVYELAVINNNMSLDSSYVNLKYELVYATILKRSNKPFFRSQEFQEYLKEFNEKLIANLLEIRKQREDKK